jgi:hypothetical protein
LIFGHGRFLLNIFAYLSQNQSDIKNNFSHRITGMNPQSKLWKQIPQQAAGYTLRFAGLFNLQISIHFVFEI